MTEGKKPFMCKIGFHRPYTDSAWFYDVERCNYCDWVSSKRGAELLDAERKAWKQANNEGLTDFHEQMARVMKILAESRG